MSTRLRTPAVAVVTALVSTALVTTALVCAAPVSAAPVSATTARLAPDRGAAGAGVVTEWSAIAVRTVVTEHGRGPDAALYLGFASLAVHDAVVTIEGGYRPYVRLPRPRGEASAEAAAATAAYLVLRHYFPGSATNLGTDYAASLARVPDSVARRRGQLVGAAAAAAIIWLRRNDGRDAAITLDGPPTPGAWRPTPDAFAPMAVPWLGFVRPLALRSPVQIRLPGPDALDSAGYARDFAEVKAYGAGEGSARTARQTETALFWSSNVIVQYRSALRDRIGRRGYGIAAAARASALLDTSVADALVACWRAKYDHAYWRPVTAIRLAGTDGNPATSADPAWTPLLPTPPYPDYVSGHACVTGAASHTFGHLFGPDTMDVDVFSPATGTSRHFDSVTALDREAADARVWLGFHFRKAMTDGNALGHRVAARVVADELQPTRGEHRAGGR
jgi:hypothetical protein